MRLLSAIFLSGFVYSRDNTYQFRFVLSLLFLSKQKNTRLVSNSILQALRKMVKSIKPFSNETKTNPRNEWKITSKKLQASNSRDMVAVKSPVQCDELAYNIIHSEEKNGKYYACSRIESIKQPITVFSNYPILQALYKKEQQSVWMIQNILWGE